MSARITAIACMAVLAAGCASPPEIRHPELDIDVPARWTAAEPTGGEIPGNWWEEFNDPALNEVVRLALERNYDLLAAAARISQAEAEARIAGADLKPTLDFSFNAARQRRNFIGFPIPGGGGGVLSSTTTNYGVSLDTSWEVDLWGRVRAGARAALADLEAARADFYGAALSIAGQTVKAWFAMAEARLQVELSEETVKSFRSSSEQVRERYESGVRPSLDLRLSLANLEDAEALLKLRRQQLDGAVRQLEVLLGCYPARRLEPPQGLPEAVTMIPAGLPADLVRRRPDLAAAERRLAAADSRWYQARAARYPRITLTASGGTASEELGDLLDGDFRVWSLIGGLVQPIFQGGRIEAGVDRAKARSEEILAGYAGSVLSAYAEVERTLAAEAYLEERVDHLALAAEHAEAARKLAEDRYRSGLESFIAVLESQRRALTNTSRLFEVQRLRLENRVDLYLSLGGGFEMNPDKNKASEQGASPSGEESSP